MKRILSALYRYFRDCDLWLLFFALAASLYGLTLISSATRSFENSDKYMAVQIGAIILGALAYIVMSIIDLEHISSIWPPFYVVNIVLICALIIFGVGGDTTGNKSWIRIPLGGFSVGIQPAELAKIIFIITFAKHLTRLSDQKNHILSMLQLCVHFMIPFALIIVISNDYGMALSMMFIFLTMLFAGGIYFRYFVVAGSLAAVAAPIVWTTVLKQYHRDRILILFNPEMDPLDKGYHIIQSKTAIANGGVFGRGLYQGPQTQYSRLPAKHTDFIFSVAGEELGLIGCTLILLLLVTIILRLVYLAVTADTPFAMLVTAGAAGLFIFQTFENIGMCVGLTPIIGITLPFFSYGGSSIVCCYVILGAVAGLKYRRRVNIYEDSDKRIPGGAG